MKRYFEFVGGNSAKFWDSGRRHGSHRPLRADRHRGPDAATTLPDAEAAVATPRKLIAAKTAKGYPETVAR